MLAAAAAMFGWTLSGNDRSGEARLKTSRLLTSSEVMERSAQIARTVVPQPCEMKMEAERYNANAPVWDVQCVDATGRARVTLQIDGKSGDVYQLNVIPHDLYLAGPRKLEKADAADAARRWLSAVRPLGHEASMKAVDATPVRLGWMVRFDGNGTRSFATVDARTGALHVLSSGRTEYQMALRRSVTTM
jgi:hypothetical protein